MGINRIRVGDRVATLSTAALPAPVAQLVQAGDRLFIAGQTGLDFAGQLHGPGDPARQAQQAMNNVRALIVEAGGSLADITKITTTITDRGHRAAVHGAVGRALGDVFPCGTDLVLRGLGRPDLLVQIDAEAVIGRTREPDGPTHEPAGPLQGRVPERAARSSTSKRIRRFGIAQRFEPQTDWQGCAVVRTRDEIFVGGQTSLLLDGSSVAGAGRSAAAAALQAETALANLKILLAEAGSSAEDICKITVCVADRSFRSAVYPVIGRHLRGIHPVSTGLVIGGFAQPEILFELDVCVVPSRGTAHQRFRKYHSRAAKYGFAGQNLDCDFCMAVRAGRHVFLRGQTGMDLDEKLQGDGYADIQADQAMKNVSVLLGEAGAGLADVTRAVLYVTDRAFQARALAAVMRHFGDTAPAVSVMIVDGLASPELLMEIDVYAMLTEGD